jgi:DNA repair exonuclease SbcCD ATPase subunit
MSLSDNKLTRERIEAAIDLIEEQKEGADREYYLHDIGVSSSLDIDIYERATGAFDTLLALANAELERQSVTEEDVAEAIERVNEQINTLADIIDELVEEQGEEAMVEDVKEALRVEITCLAALQTYRPGREPCNWREAPIQNTTGYIQYGCYRLDASCWNFCPVCGRKLDKVVPV